MLSASFAATGSRPPLALAPSSPTPPATASGGRAPVASPLPGSAHRYAPVTEIRNYLVVLGQTIEPELLAALERETGAQGSTQRLAPGAAHRDAFRLADVQDTPVLRQRVSALLEGQRIDHGFVPAGRTLDTVGLAQFDMDETLTNYDSTTKLRALMGPGTEEKELALRAKRDAAGLYKFDPGSKKERTMLLAGLEEWRARELATRLTAPDNMKPGAEAALDAYSFARRVVSSGSFKLFTEPLCVRYRLDAHHAIELEIVDGRLTGRIIGDTMPPESKVANMDAEMRYVAAGKVPVMFGDSDNDILAFLRAIELGGVAFAFQSKYEAARTQATHAIDYAGLDATQHFFLPAA
jgi:phosphoserine phosphatase